MILIFAPRNGVCQSARLRELRMRSWAAPIANTRSAVTYVLLARNKTRPRGFFLPGHSFVTVRQAEDCSGAVRLFLQNAVPSV